MKKILLLNPLCGICGYYEPELSNNWHDAIALISEIYKFSELHTILGAGQ